jgi:two-component system sensor histidine kinase MprB
MSLRRRITAVVAVAVAAIAILIGAAGYLSTRSQLISGVRQELLQRADAEAGHSDPAGLGNPGFGTARPGTGRQTSTTGFTPGFRGVPSPAFGGAPGFPQHVNASGTVTQFGSSTAGEKLPVTQRVLAVAKGTASRFFFDARVDGTHVEILTMQDAFLGGAIEIALPLTDVDNDLSSLLVTYAIIAAAGVLVAILIALLVARAAIAPIGRFITETAQVTRSLAKPRRLEETGADELRHLAVYFNQTLEALERSVAAQRHLIADASHELRTPLAALRSNIQIFLEAERLPVEDRAELQEAIVAEVDDLTQLVSDVLELARGAAPSDAVEQVELDGLVRDAVSRTQRRAPGLSFDLDIEPTLIMNNPDRVGRAVQNVIDNARKWSPEEGTVHVELRDGTLSVRDHGPGFREEDLPSVFDRFFRADDARRMPGSGLGLAIVKQAVEAHGGSAYAANAEGGGALIVANFGEDVTNLLSLSNRVVTKQA